MQQISLENSLPLPRNRKETKNVLQLTMTSSCLLQVKIHLTS